MRFFDWLDKVEKKAKDNTASRFERWLWENWLSHDSDTPNFSKSLAKAQTTDIELFYQRLQVIADRHGITPDEAVVRYFTLLDTYTRACLQVKLKHITVDPIKIQEWKTALNELFKGMRQETLEVVGKPYFFKMGFWSPPDYYHLWVEGRFRCAADVDDPANEGKWSKSSIEDFLTFCKFQSAI